MHELFPQYSIGHFINQPQNPTDFEIMRFEDMIEPEVADVHKHSFYEILWVEEGMSRQTIDFKSYELGPASLFFISPGQLHEFEEWQPLKGGTILFTEDFFLLNYRNRQTLFELSFLDNTYFHPRLNPMPENFSEIQNTIELLFREKQRQNADPAILQAYLTVLLHQIQRAVDTDTTQKRNTRYIVLFKEFQQLVEKGFANAATVRDYAKQLHITQHHLNRVVKEISGQSATDFIQNRKMLEAKRLLVFSDLSVSEIATSLHFFDSSYFAKSFRKGCGMSPTAFRTEMSEKYRKG